MDLAIMRCPRTGRTLYPNESYLSTQDGLRYPIRDGIPDLRAAPLQVADPLWCPAFDPLRDVQFGPPAALDIPGLPHRLDPHLAQEVGAEEGYDRHFLEIGCGDRGLEDFLVRSNFRYTGIDVEVRGQGPTVLADAHNLPFKDETFNTVFTAAVLHHVPSPLTVMQETHRVMVPGGRFVGTVAFCYGDVDHATFNLMGPAALAWNLRVAGFSDIRIWADWPYWQSVPDAMFHGRHMSWPWQRLAELVLRTLERSYITVSNAGRALCNRKPIDPELRAIMTAGSLSFSALRV